MNISRINRMGRLLMLSVFILASCSKSNIYISDKFIKEIALVNERDNNKNNAISCIPEKAINLVYLKLNNGKINMY
ncbi:hypothetical protein D1631_08945 [Chryseobacterium nematophagum]|uniref:Lipoprotein n=1 Tax=Chryseobacterium nematophagum TaxID=2305228 RepID=A0A3M7TEN2_9FLAO|nr:hypothetical protein [Chryseobacterium nematophagum]RNA62052.1 hypothetical protein D1631_08945 [Chryseobacterium nematophagum]